MGSVDSKFLIHGLPSGPQGPRGLRLDWRWWVGKERRFHQKTAGWDEAALSPVPSGGKPPSPGLGLQVGLLEAGCHLAASVRIAGHGVQRR